METIRRSFKPLAHLIVFALLGLTIQWPAHAALVDTETLLNAEQSQAQRAQVEGLLERQEIAERLTALGVDPAAVKARVDALTDREVQLLAERLEGLPAGGDVLGAVVFVFVVLLITDILGFTDVFPFVKKPVRR